MLPDTDRQPGRRLRTLEPRSDRNPLCRRPERAISRCPLSRFRVLRISRSRGLRSSSAFFSSSCRRHSSRFSGLFLRRRFPIYQGSEGGAALITHFAVGAVLMFIAIWILEERNRRSGGRGFTEIRWLLLIFVLLLLVVPLGTLLSVAVLGLLALMVLRKASWR